MKKIQLCLSENLYEEFSLIASQEQKSISFVIKEYLKQSIQKKKNNGLAILIELSENTFKGGYNLSSKIDKVVYK